MKERHLLALSGGKDSAALAVYMKEKYPRIPMEYVFIDSGCELPETHAYLDRIKVLLDIHIIVIGGAAKDNRKDFNWWLKQKNYYLPSPNKRWCTEVLKLLPFAKWLKKECSDSVVHNYVGLRADEKSERTGFTLTHECLKHHHPFVEDGLVYDDIKALLLSSGIGFPDYYDWRSRSGCFFCFFQTKREWIGLYRKYPEKFEEAAKMEKIDPETGKQYTWNEGYTLYELIKDAEEIENNCGEFLHGLDKQPKLISLLKDVVSDNVTYSKILK